MKAILNRLIQQDTLNKEEAKSILVNISKGEYNSSQIASFLTIFMMRTITIDELSGFKDALLELCIPVPIKEYGAIDLCGTGGDSKDTFNISTLASFITAGAGVHVAKHGNYGVSSSCGSSNVMEFLGINFTNDINFHKKALDQANICVLHAPLFHPAMKNVAPIRRELGVKTFFNMLGPMVNPSFPILSHTTHSRRTCPPRRANAHRQTSLPLPLLPACFPTFPTPTFGNISQNIYPSYRSIVAAMIVFDLTHTSCINNHKLH